MIRARPLLAGALAWAAGCAWLPPKAPAPKLADRAPLAGAPIDFDVAAHWPASDWWRNYHDPTLNELIRLGLASAPSLEVAQRRLDLARETVRQTGAALGVHVALDADFTRQRLSDNGLLPPRFLGFSWYNQADLGLQFTYTLDWWGKQRAALESAVDSARASDVESRAAALSLASSIAETYFGWQVDEARLELAREQIVNAERSQDIAAARVTAELESPDTLQTAREQRANARERAAVLDGSVRLRIVTLGALVGRAPAELPLLVVRELPAIEQELPADAGIDLLARRADIAASRWRVEAAQKNLTGARAAYYPDLSLKLLAGLQSIEISKLLNAGSGVPLATAAIHLPIFDAGRLSAQYGASKAQLYAAIANYRDTVVTAAREVATEASMRRQIIDQRSQRLAAVAAADGVRRAAGARVGQGLTDLRPQLAAGNEWLSQRDALLELEGEALSRDIGLQRALGGGYRRDLTP